jgi:phage FluMu gp28-like protein
MATTYTWDIENVDLISSHNGNENVVFRVTWKCTADDGEGNSKYQVGIVELDPNVDSETFLSIDNVTKQDIIGWVKNTVAVSVIERDLLPNVTTITFAGTGTTTSTTVAEALASTIAKRSETPDPNNP